MDLGNHHEKIREWLITKIFCLYIKDNNGNNKYKLMCVYICMWPHIYFAPFTTLFSIVIFDSEKLLELCTFYLLLERERK